MSDNDAPAMDYKAHTETYESFIKFSKWGTISVIVLLVLMAIFLL